MEASARVDHAQDEDSLAGRVALVTGGTRGIGAAISSRLARRGAAVAAGFSSDRAPTDPGRGHDRGFASLAASLSDTAREPTGERAMLIKEACLGLSREVARYGSNHPIWATTQRPRYSSMAAPRQTPGSPQHVRTERWTPASLTCSDRSTTSWSSSAAVVGTAAVVKHGHDRREDRRDDRGPGIFR
jgi:hypothetical protein